MTKDDFMRLKAEVGTATEGESVANMTLEQCQQQLWEFISYKRSIDKSIAQTISEERVIALIEDFLDQYHPCIEEFTHVQDGMILNEMGKLKEHLINVMTGYDILTDAWVNPEIKEIQVNAYDNIWVEKGSEFVRLVDKNLTIINGGDPDGPPDEHTVYASFKDSKALLEFANKLLRISNCGDTNQLSATGEKCIASAISPEGFRITMVGPGGIAAMKGDWASRGKSPAICIRKHPENSLTAEQLIQWSSFSDQMNEFFQVICRYGANIVVAAETGAGKTAILQILLNYRPEDQRMIIMEKDSELVGYRTKINSVTGEKELIHNNYVQFEYIRSDDAQKKSNTNNTDENLFNQSMRFTPQGFAIGEAISKVDMRLLKEISLAGHPFLTTLHSNSPSNAVKRISNDLEGDERTNLQQIAEAIDIVIIPSKLMDHSRRITTVAEIVGVKEENGVLMVNVNPLFVFKQEIGVMTDDGKFVGKHWQVGHPSHILEEKLGGKGWLPGDRERINWEASPDNPIPGTYTMGDISSEFEEFWECDEETSNTDEAPEPVLSGETI